jgi:hypothetical protein
VQEDGGGSGGDAKNPRADLFVGVGVKRDRGLESYEDERDRGSRR